MKINKILIILVFIFFLGVITGCSKQPLSKDYVTCGIYASCPEGYNLSFIGGQCQRCYVASDINYTFDFECAPKNISSDLTAAYNAGVVDTVLQLIQNADNCSVAVLTVNGKAGTLTRDLIDTDCINNTRE